MVRDWQSKVTDFLEQGPTLEADSPLGSQGILFLLWNLKVYYHVHKNWTKSKAQSNVLPLYVVLLVPPPAEKDMTLCWLSQGEVVH